MVKRTRRFGLHWLWIPLFMGLRCLLIRGKCLGLTILHPFFFVLTRRTFPGHSCGNAKSRQNPQLQCKIEGYEAEEDPDFFHDVEGPKMRAYSALFFMLCATMVKKALSSSLIDWGTFVSSIAASMSSSQRSASALPMGNGACLILSLGCPRLA